MTTDHTACLRVFVYWNLHRACWSIKALSGPDRGRVVAHASAWDVRRADFKVSEAGRQRVIREQRKNVHAGIVGYLVAWERDANLGAWAPSASSALVDSVDALQGGHAVTYNPYTGPHFVTREGRHPVAFAPQVVAQGRTVLALRPRFA